MFGKKARLLKVLQSQVKTLEETCAAYLSTTEVQRDTLRKVKEECNELASKLEAAEEVSHAKDGRIIELQGLRKTDAEEIAMWKEQVEKWSAKFETSRNEVATLTDELQKCQEKLMQTQEELRLSREGAAEAARRSYSEAFNDFPHEPEKKAAPEPGIGDYGMGRTHPEFSGKIES